MMTLAASMLTAAMAGDAKIRIACVGDSITFGVFSSGPTKTYPARLQQLLGDGYNVTNLGAGYACMQKDADHPYWVRDQYKEFISNTWDIVVIMLGTNDAKDTGNGGPPNWPHNCTGPNGLECPYAQDYASLINIARGLGTAPEGPQIHVAIPPPLMNRSTYGMNQSVINEVFPQLIPRIASHNNISSAPIDVFDALGGGMQSQFPPNGCTLETSHDADCADFCDQQSCDQCHPNDDGYLVLAKAVKKGLGL
eukprot:TRINITY_DN6156_c2_g1_i1.p1 TRINITY_DN6156_c2_g1~~TRINITY_DN6156_c2_g1_i1.p1  ORF type:complete len:252 (+),score=25.83 TRINITY_DN6156_c2_g1_i1:205-960(+)